MDALRMEKMWELKRFYPETKPLLKQQKKRENLNLNKEVKYHIQTYIKIQNKLYVLSFKNQFRWYRSSDR